LFFLSDKNLADQSKFFLRVPFGKNNLILALVFKSLVRSF